MFSQFSTSVAFNALQDNVSKLVHVILDLIKSFDVIDLSQGHSDAMR